MTPGLHRLLATCAAVALIAGCGGGSNGGTNSNNVTAPSCDVTRFAAGAPVSTPTAAQLATFAGTYNGNEGSFDESFTTFTPTGPAVLILTTGGSVTYNNTARTVDSACVESLSVPANGQMLVLHFAMGHVDLLAGGIMSGVSPADGISIIQSTDTGGPDTTAPMVTVPSAITVQAASPGDTSVPASHSVIAAFLSNATAVDNVDGVLTAAITHDAPASFPLGTTTVTFSVTDASGNTGTASSAVTVTANTGAADTVAPVVTAPGNLTVQAASGANSVPATNTAIAAFLAGATAIDDVDGVLTAAVIHDAPTDFPVGTTTVTFSVTDAAGNTGTATATVTVNAASGGNGGLTLPTGTVISSGTATITYQGMPAIPGGKIITFEQGAAKATLYDYVDTLGVGVGDTGLSIGIDPYNACALDSASVDASTPACASVGVDFNRATGQVSFTATPMKPIVFTCPGDCTISGTLSFTPY